MINWLRSLFNPPTEVSHVTLETYRGEVKRPTQAAPEVSTFSPSVPWATTASQLPLSATPPPKPPPVEDPMNHYRSADASGIMLCYSGIVSFAQAGYQYFTGSR